MDPGLALAIAELAGKAIRALAQYSISFIKAQEARHRLIAELRCIRDMLENVSSQVDSSTDGDMTLANFLQKLTDDQAKRSCKGKLAWPFEEKKIGQFLTKIERCKSDITLAFAMNTDMRSERIERNTMMIARGQTRARLDSEKAEKARLREACIRWLETEGNAGKLSAVIAQRQDGTCRWLFEHYTYKRWIAASNGFLCWKRQDGTGAIMEDQHPAVVYHFCDFRNTSSISVTSVLHSILSQSLRSGPVEWLNAGGIASKDEISEAMTSDSKANELILIPHLLHLSRTCNVFASSRDEHSIRVLLKDELTICLHGETDLVNGDIRAHTLHELRNKPRLSRLPRQEILDALLPKANCMFRWVQCQLYLLEKCKTLLAMKTVLSNLPKTLYETYERILRSISGENAELGEERIVRYTLRWLVGASRPLRLNELNDAIAIEVGCSTLSDDLRVIDATDILTSCGSLVRFDKGEGDGEYVVGLSHFTVQEYLLTAALARDSNLGLYAMTLPDMHRDLALLCLAYVLLDAFRDGPCVDKSSLDRRIQTFPMYPYATRHWAEHVRQIPEYDDEVYTTIKRLLGDEETEPQRLAMCQRDLWPHSHWETYDVPAQPWLVVLAQRTWLARHIVSEFPEWVTIGITQRADVPRIPFDAVFSDNEWAERYMRDIITPLTPAWAYWTSPPSFWMLVLTSTRLIPTIPIRGQRST
ncbi:hypothetical protein K523DRAFT_412605 [Schizophyllum commune Tattone D]|nr:hypothetical protein K523DRAFT_412605 [Schizophyllum commune Tattone D]